MSFVNHDILMAGLTPETLEKIITQPLEVVQEDLMAARGFSRQVGGILCCGGGPFSYSFKGLHSEVRQDYQKRLTTMGKEELHTREQLAAVFEVYESMVTGGVRPGNLEF